jgi:hypothetical protein
MPVECLKLAEERSSAVVIERLLWRRQTPVWEKWDFEDSKTRTATTISLEFYLSAITTTDRYNGDRLTRVSMRPT